MYEEALLARAGAGEVLVRVHAAAVTPTELGMSRGVRVNVISPGLIKTPLYGRLRLTAEQASEVAASIQAQISLKHFGTPSEVASAVLYLSSAKSGFIVGTELVIDGGMSQL